MSAVANKFMYKQPPLVDHKRDPAGSWPMQDWGCTFQYLLFPFFFVLENNFPFFPQLWQLRSARQSGDPSNLQDKQSPISMGKWNDSAVKWPFSASLRTINMSPSNLHVLKPCLPYTQVITRLLCVHVQSDVWALLALCSRRDPARGFFLPPGLARGSDTISSLLLSRSP